MVVVVVVDEVVALLVDEVAALLVVAAVVAVALLEVGEGVHPQTLAHLEEEYRLGEAVARSSPTLQAIDHRHQDVSRRRVQTKHSQAHIGFFFL